MSADVLPATPLGSPTPTSPGAAVLTAAPPQLPARANRDWLGQIAWDTLRDRVDVVDVMSGIRTPDWFGQDPAVRQALVAVVDAVLTSAGTYGAEVAEARRLARTASAERAELAGQLATFRELLGVTLGDRDEYLEALAKLAALVGLRPKLPRNADAIARARALLEPTPVTTAAADGDGYRYAGPTPF
jgi:hypothetical protein